MDLIHQFMESYKRRYNYYETAGRLAARQLEAALQSSGIRAIVTSRAKNPGRLKTKVCQRNQERDGPYKTMAEIYEDIADLSGVRISLYFPGDREKADSLVSSLFIVYEKVSFPGESGQPSYNKRFSGYWANHYRASLKEEGLEGGQKKYAAARIEIQVASVLMHAWSEVEHDLVYKPLQGTLSEEELYILDELNGLVLTGEIALERLQAAGNERIKSKDATFASQYDLASYLYNYLSRKCSRSTIESRLGDVELLFKLAVRLKLDSVKNLEPVLRSLKIIKDKRTLSQQIIDLVINGNEKRYKLYKDLRGDGDAMDPALLEAVATFTRLWIPLESHLTKLTCKINPKARGTFNVNTLKRAQACCKEDMGQITLMRAIRNNLVHRIEIPDKETLARLSDEIRRISAKLDGEKQGA